MTAALAMVAPLVGAAAKKSGSSPALLIFVVIAAAFYFLIYRPQQRKSKAAKVQMNAFDVGDEVLTAGGIVGYIIDIDGDRVTLETSVGASFVVLKQYVLRRLETAEPVDEDEDSEYEHDDEEQAELPEGSHEEDVEEHDDGDPVDDEEEQDGASPNGNQKSGGTDDASGVDGPPII